MFTYFFASAVRWYGQNKVTRNTLIHVCPRHAMSRLAGREALSGAFIIFASAREGMAPPPAMT